MYFQHIFASAIGVGNTVESSFLIAIAVLACVLGAEIAGICILINKMIHARRQKNLRELDEPMHEPKEEYRNYAVPLLMLGAVPAVTQMTLYALCICTALASLVFLVLLIVFFVKGYAFASAKTLREQDRAIEEAVASNEAFESVDEEAPAEEALPADEESSAEEAVLICAEKVEAEASDDAEETVVCPAEETEETEEVTAQETVHTEEPAAEVEAPAQTPAEEVAASVIPHTAPYAVAQAGTTPGGIPVYSSAYPGGQVPFVEKHITETFKEVIKETNTTTTTTNTTPAAKAEEKYSPATEEILKAIAELMKLGTQLRMEHEMAVENPAVKKDETVAAFAENEEEEETEELDLDEAEDDDELDAEDAAEKKDDEDGDGDDEYESDLFSSSGRIVGFDEETGCYIVAHYRKSFEAKLIQARPNVKKYYSEIKNALLSYEGTKDRITWTINSYNNEHTQIAKINVRTRTLDLYLALDPASLEDTVYHGRDVGNKKKYAETPFLYKVNSPRKLTLALELVQRACEEQGLSPIDIETVNYEESYPFDTTENLVSRGLIREYLREEKPAVTFELDPDHVPQLPEEDESVIPANANFTWEFDNDRMPEPEPEPEVVPEPEPEPEPAPEPAPEPEPEPIVEAPSVVVETVETPASTTTTTTTSHETVKVTERHYTERYFGTPAQSMQVPMQLAANAQPIEAIAEPVATETATETVTETVSDTEEQAPIEVAAEPVVEEAPIETIEVLAEEPAEESVEEALAWDPFEEASSDELPRAEAEEDLLEETVEDASEEENFEEEAIADEEEEIFEEEETADDAEEALFEEEEVTDEEEEIFEEEETEDEIKEEAFEEESEVIEEGEEAEEVEEAPVAPAPKAAPAPGVALLDVCLFDEYFENGATVNLEALKEVGLAPASAHTLKVYASGALKGQYTVEANHFTLDAIKAIGDADGDSIMIR